MHRVEMFFEDPDFFSQGLPDLALDEAARIVESWITLFQLAPF